MNKSEKLIDRSNPKLAPVFARMSSARIADTTFDVLLRWAETGIPNSGRRRGWYKYTCPRCKKPKRSRTEIIAALYRCLPCRRKAAS